MPSNRRIGHKTKGKFKKSFGKYINGLHRRIAVYLQDSTAECPNCYYDKVNDVSSGIPKVNPGDTNYFTVGRCPVCNGKGVLTTTRRRFIKGLIIWNPTSDNMNDLTFTPAGYEGATRVEIKTDPEHLNSIKNSKHVIIDGIRCKLSNPPTVRGIGKQSILVAQFFTEDKADPSSGETVIL